MSRPFPVLSVKGEFYEKIIVCGVGLGPVARVHVGRTVFRLGEDASINDAEAEGRAAFRHTPRRAGHNADARRD